MKNYCLLFLLVNVLSISGQSVQPETKNSLSIGYGLPNLYKLILRQNVEFPNRYARQYEGYDTDSYAYTSFGLNPLFLKYDQRIKKHIGVGLVCGYFLAGLEQKYFYKGTTAGTNAENYTNITRVKIHNLSLGFRFNYHFGIHKRIDPYLGFALGYTYFRSGIYFSSNNPNARVNDAIQPANPLPVPLYLGLTAGVKIYLWKNLGLYTELGLDKWAIIQAGLAFKFK